MAVMMCWRCNSDGAYIREGPGLASGGLLACSEMGGHSGAARA